MDAETTKAALAEKVAHAKLMEAHAELMRAQTRVTVATAVEMEKKVK